jgi:hypothetical protein
MHVREHLPPTATAAAYARTQIGSGTSASSAAGGTRAQLPSAVSMTLGRTVRAMVLLIATSSSETRVFLKSVCSHLVHSYYDGGSDGGNNGSDDDNSVLSAMSPVVNGEFALLSTCAVRCLVGY